MIHNIQHKLKASLTLLKMVLGIYLYGSALIGGLQKYSDVDLLVVTNCSTTTDKKIN